jgi:aspartate racemase
MKTIGIVGGIGPESTVEYYHLLIAAHHTSIVINSIDVDHLVDAMTEKDLTRVVDDLSTAVRALARAGAEVALLAANSPHIVFDEVRRRSPIPMVSIVEATCDHVRAAGWTRVGLFGTRFTMDGGLYQDVFARHGVEVVVPDAPERAYLHEKYLSELLKGIFLPETRGGLLAIADALAARAGIEALILGGTELPLLLRGASHSGVPLLDTTRIHVDAVLRHAA